MAKWIIFPRIAHLAESAMTAAGLVLVATPLALWASPSPQIYYIVLISCGAAYGAVVLLSKRDPGHGGKQASRAAGENGIALPDTLIDEPRNRREPSRREVHTLNKIMTGKREPPKRGDD